MRQLTVMNAHHRQASRAQTVKGMFVAFAFLFGTIVSVLGRENFDPPQTAPFAPGPGKDERAICTCQPLKV